ncbi:hypothetical protein JCM13304A_10780 [Desulfothermus okinawensis JCM 13304]
MIKDKGIEHSSIIYKFSIFEKLVRRLYHDGANLFGPLKEIVAIKIEGNVGNYLSKNLSYYLSLLKNLRFYYLFTQNPNFFQEEYVTLEDILKESLLDISDLVPGQPDVFVRNSHTYLKCLREPFYMILYNLLTNAYRFGDNVTIKILQSNKIEIENRPISIVRDVKSIFEFCISEDKYGIVGVGVGLNIVKEIAEFLKIKIESYLEQDSVKVYIDFNPLLV